MGKSIWIFIGLCGQSLLIPANSWDLYNKLTGNAKEYLQILEITLRLKSIHTVATIYAPNAWELNMQINHNVQHTI